MGIVDMEAEGSKIPFEVWTHHKNLEVLRTPQTSEAQYFNQFNFELKYIPGGKNFLADALSLIPQYKSTSNHRATGKKESLGPQWSIDTVGEKRTSNWWFRPHQRELTLRGEMAWKGDKLSGYVPDSLQIQVLQQTTIPNKLATLGS